MAIFPFFCAVSVSFKRGVLAWQEHALHAAGSGFLRVAELSPDRLKNHSFFPKKPMIFESWRVGRCWKSAILRPFDVWLLMKDEEDIATAGGSKVGSIAEHAGDGESDWPSQI